jgi:glycosyltransferase involved in cell wall biosynthesis
MGNKSYALITAAKNEEAYIESVLRTVIGQTQLPYVWAIVSDGSTDRTDDIVREYVAQHSFIRLIRLDNAHTRSFSSQAVATTAGYESIKSLEFDFVGFLDADISLASDYYEILLARFDSNSRLGIAGGQIVERARSGAYEPRDGNSPDEVAGAVQLLRRRCYDGIGGLVPLRWGGHDAVANAMARRAGWEVRTFSDLHVRHHRLTGTAGVTLNRARFREGMQDYFMGYHPIFEIGKCVRRVSEPPCVVGSVARLCGFLWPGITRQKRTVPADFVSYLKRQQVDRMLHTVWKNDVANTYRS